MFNIHYLLVSVLVSFTVIGLCHSSPLMSPENGSSEGIPMESGVQPGCQLVDSLKDGVFLLQKFVVKFLSVSFSKNNLLKQESMYDN